MQSGNTHRVPHHPQNAMHQSMHKLQHLVHVPRLLKSQHEQNWPTVFLSFAQTHSHPTTILMHLHHPHSKERPAPYPIAGALIPNLRRGPRAWRQAVEQWDEGVPSQGVPPLKDWPASWYTGRMRLTHGAKRGERETIAKEYER